jgi:hypothetical protein
MIHKFTMALLLPFALFSGSANAGFTAPSTIEGYDIGNRGKLIFRLSALNTYSTAKNLFAVANTEPYYDSMLAMVMPAYAAKQKVQVWPVGCDTDNANRVVRILVGNVW